MYWERSREGAYAAPPVPDGPVQTVALSARGAGIIRGAAYRAVAEGLPLVTFMTFTLRSELREHVESGELVLSRELRRVLNAVRERERRRGGSSDFAYIWVAENPRGENPHVHLLTSASVSRSEFLSWAGWLESLWGHGWVHIERIRVPEAAGRYILKAVGYLGKGSDGSQGPIRGRRYGVSANIRPRVDRFLVDDSAAAVGVLSAVAGEIPDGAMVKLSGGRVLTRWGMSFPLGSGLPAMLAELGSLELGVVPE